MSAQCKKTIPNEGARRYFGLFTFNTHFCAKPAAWHTFLGQDLCEEHAEEWVKAMQSPDAAINVLAGKPGMTEEEARKRLWPIQ